MRRLSLLLALALCGCVDAQAGTTGLSTQQARTAAPSNGVDLAAGAASEGSSLAFMRADAQLTVKNILSPAHGGMGGLSCAGNATTATAGVPACSSALTETSVTGPSATALTLQGNIAHDDFGPAIQIQNATTLDSVGDQLIARISNGGLSAYSFGKNTLSLFGTNRNIAMQGAGTNEIDFNGTGVINFENAGGEIFFGGSGTMIVGSIGFPGDFNLNGSQSVLINTVSGGTVGLTTPSASVALGNLNGDFLVNNSGGGGVSIFTTSAFTVTSLALSGFVRANGSGLLTGGNTVEHDFSAFRNTFATPSAAAFSRTKVTNASTLTADSYYTPVVVGVGGGSFVLKLCSDGTTCGAGNVYLTCTNNCTATVGTPVACTVTKSAVSAATTLTWGVATACATTDPGFNVNAHMTTP